MDNIQTSQLTKNELSIIEKMNDNLDLLLEIRDKNILSQGDSITRPAENSYLVQRCVSLISDNLTQAPAVLYNKTTGDPIPSNDPVYRIIDRPNYMMSRYDFWASIGAYFSLYGEAPIYIMKTAGNMAGIPGLPYELWPLDPRGLKEVIDPSTRTLKGWLFNRNLAIMPDELLMLKVVNPYNIFRGLSPLDSAKTELNIDYKSGRYQESFFINGAVPSVVLQTDPDDNTDDKELHRIAKKWDKIHKGALNANKTAVLSGGMTFKTVGLSQSEMDFISSRKFTRETIALAFGVHTAILGITESQTRDNMDASMRFFWQTKIKPIFLNIQSRYNTFFFPVYAPNILLKFDFTKIEELQRNYKDDIGAARELWQMGYTPNELNKRFEFGFEEISDLDQRQISIQVVPYDQPLEMDPNESQERSIDNTVKKDSKEFTEKQIRSRKVRQIYLRRQNGHERQFKNKINSYFLTQKGKILKKLMKYNKSFEATEILATINILTDEDIRLVNLVTPIMSDTIIDAQKMAIEILGVKRDVILNNEILQSKVNRIKGINQTTWKNVKKQVFDGIDEGESIDMIADRIRSVYNTATSKSNLTRIARTETAQAMNEATNEEYRINGVNKKSWVTAGDGRVRETCAQAEAAGDIDINATFPQGLKYPQEVNCRCCISPEF